MNSFKTSVNVKFDIGDSSFIDRYLATPSHAEILIALSKSFTQKGQSAANIMIGPYGSGKSLVAKVIADIVSNSIEYEKMNELIYKYKNVHQDVYDSLNKLIEYETEFIPIVLNGNEGNFSETIIYNIYEAFLSRGIEFNKIGIIESIEWTIDNWRVNYPQLFEQFINLLNIHGYILDKWLLEINKNNSVEVDWFRNTYQELSGGAIFERNLKFDLVEHLEEIKIVLQREKLGVFIIFDEFGRFLQSLSNNEITDTMQDIQDIAEYINRENRFFQLLLISHKSMSQYMSGFQEEYRSEFRRVEKRYDTYFIESDTATYYRMVEQQVSLLAKECAFQVPILEESLNKLRSYNLFEELNAQELEMIVVYGAYPIHPITLFLLPKVSQVFGQNERTLFTFLESEESFTLRNHMTKNKGFYYSDQLFDYFFNETEINSLEDESKSILKLYSKNLNKIGKAKRNENARKVLKFITLWQVTHSNANYPLDIEFIEYGTGLSNLVVTRIINEMIDHKFIRQNRVLGIIELYEGSPVVLSEVINEQRNNMKIDNLVRIERLQNLLPKSYYFSHEYNDKKNITRFFKIYLNYNSKLLNAESMMKAETRKNEDGKVHFIIVDEPENLKETIRQVKLSNNPFNFYVIVKKPFNEIADKIDQIIAITELLEDKELMVQSNYLKEELEIHYQDLVFDTINFLKDYYEFDKNATWFYMGDSINLKSKLAFEQLLSNLMFKYYPEMPVIMNDAIQRFFVKGVQERSLHKVLQKVIDNPYEENLGISGFGPDYLIFATIIKNNGINFSDLNNIPISEFSNLRLLLLKYLKNNSKGNLSEIKNLMQSSPFGIRPPLIPLYFFILIRDVFDQLLVYKNDLFIPINNGVNIYEMFNLSDEYSYVFHDFDEEEMLFLNNVLNVVNNYVSEYVIDKTTMVKVSSGLLSWLRSQERYSQMTEECSSGASELKQIIRRSEINPLSSIEELYEIYGKDFKLLTTHMKEIENLYQHQLDGLRSFLFELFSNQNKDQLFDHYTNEEINSNDLLRLLERENEFEDFLAAYIGTHPSKWTDVSTNLFMKQAANDYNKLVAGDFEDDEFIQIEINGTYKRVQKVDLSHRAENIQSNIERMLKSASRSVSKEEIDRIVLAIVEKYLD